EILTCGLFGKPLPTEAEEFGKLAHDRADSAVTEAGSKFVRHDCALFGDQVERDAVFVRGVVDVLGPADHHEEQAEGEDDRKQEEDDAVPAHQKLAPETPAFRPGRKARLLLLML